MIVIPLSLWKTLSFTLLQSKFKDKTVWLLLAVGKSKRSNSTKINIVWLEPEFQFFEDERVNISDLKTFQRLNVEYSFEEVNVEADSGGNIEVDEVDPQMF